jgi:hypothetical protein
MQQRVGRVKTSVTLGAIAVLLALAHLAVLHVVLFRSGARARRGEPI